MLIKAKNHPTKPARNTPRNYVKLRGAFWLLGLILFFSLTACTRSKSQAPTTLTPASQPIRFTNVAQQVGLNFRHGAFRWEVSADPAAMMGGGLCWLDYNKDGWLDLFVVNSYAEQEAGQWAASGGLPTSALFQNIRGKFTDVSQITGTALPLRGQGCVAADFNLDGWTDLYITTARVNVLLWNQGGIFVEGAVAAGVDAYGWQTTAVAGDLNEDGWPDLFVAGYVDVNNRNPESAGGFPNSFLGLRDLLFINEGLDHTGRARFREVGELAGLKTSEFEYGLGALLSDLDADGDLDLYIANDTNPNRLYMNIPWPGGKAADPAGVGFRFEEVGGAVRVDDTHSGMGVAGGDYDNNGLFDLLVTNMGNQVHSVYRNQSTGQDLAFQDFSGLFNLEGIESTGWGSSWGDFDLDTDLDLVIVTGNIPISDLAVDGQITQMFGNLTAQGQPGRFADWTEAAGLMAVGPLIGRGGAAADYDNDGDLDYAINQIGGPLVLLQNNAKGNWLSVQLDRFAPGTVITIMLPNGQEFQREIHAGSSYHSSEDPRTYFGLGTFEKVLELRVRWWAGGEFVLKDVQANQQLTVDFKPLGPSEFQSMFALYLPVVRLETP